MTWAEGLSENGWRVARFGKSAGPSVPAPLSGKLLASVICLVFVFICGCADVSDQAADKDDDDGVARSKVELGPVRVKVEVEPAKARLSDEPVLTLTIDHQRGVTVRKPPFGEAIGEFVIRDFREPLPRIEGDREILEQTYTLEPMRTGKLAIAPISVSFIDSRADGDNKEYTLQTEAITVEVASVVDSEVPSLAELRSFAGPVDVPKSGGFGLLWFLLPVAFLVAGGLVLWYVRRRMRKPEEEKRLSPEELAYMELERILHGNLAEEDVKQFFVELTGVVRRYIERTKGVHAPEQTTEEFLREIGSKGTFLPDESKRLQMFLESADLVKFAAHQPRKEDVEESFQRAKVFIGLERLEVAA